MGMGMANIARKIIKMSLIMVVGGGFLVVVVEI